MLGPYKSLPPALSGLERVEIFVGNCWRNALDWIFLGRGAEAKSSRARCSDLLRTLERKGPSSTEEVEGNLGV